MEYLEGKGMIAAGTRVDLLGNGLVIVAPRGEGFAVKARRGFDFAGAFAGRLAVGDPDHVPAGMYARQALEGLGWWTALENRLAPAPDVRAALVYVERGQCPAGIVYATDAAVSARVEVIARLPEEAHEPIVYPVAAVKGGDSAGAGKLLEFFCSDTAASVFARHGFAVPQAPAAEPGPAKSD
jgi:molybdate transport system substrate-binding protein